MKGGEVDVETDTPAGRPRRDRLPRNRQRERVLALVREHDDAVDAVELASQMGLHITTVRFHLDALCDEEVIVRTRMNRPGRGRPRTGYRAVEERVDYRTLAEVLAMELGQTEETRGRRAQHAGQKWAARIAVPQETSEPDAGDVLDRAAVNATAAFKWMGFAPELVTVAEPTPPPVDSGPAPEREKSIRMHACPVRDLARSRPEVVCGMHLGLLQGLLDKSAADEGLRKSARRAMRAHLEPFVEPGLCVARLVVG
jgi:predicted ArsR family transcriptional regulator